MPAIPHPAAARRDLPWQETAPQTRRIAAQSASHGDLAPPMGGIGAGTLGFGTNGGLVRATLDTQRVDYATWPGAGFAIWQDGADGPSARALMLQERAPDSWTADPTGQHAALFPKGWHSAREGALDITFEQISPVAPGVGDDLDLPAAVIRAHFTNTGATPLPAAAMLCMPNLVGAFAPGAGPVIAGQRAAPWQSDAAAGVAMTRDFVGRPDQGEGTMALLAATAHGVEISACPAFDPAAEGAALWTAFANDGRAQPPGPVWLSGGGFAEHPEPRPMAAVAARLTLAPGETRTVDFALAWDLPMLRFGQGRLWARHHATRWGRAGDAAPAIAAHALTRAQAWSQAVDAFHDDAAARIDLPDGAIAAVINELYFLIAGMAVWTAPDHGRPAQFALIECPDYALHATLDLWVYAAAAVADLFPELADTVVTAYAEAVADDDPTPRRHLKSSARFARAQAGRLPTIWVRRRRTLSCCVNDYTYQDSTQWKDLGAMFVLTAWRSARDAPPERVRALLGPVTQTMEALAVFDRDGDGVIENDGVPDQTFDNIPLSGISAYCGGLWLAALRAAAALADRAGDSDEAARWQGWSSRAEPAFTQALWTGTHFRLDSAGPFTDAVFAEQMFAPATARMLGLGDIVPEEMARTALATVVDRNFRVSGDGRGAVAIAASGPASPHAPSEAERGLQWDEALVGCNYSLAAALRVYGMEAECRALMAALARELGPRRGFTFRTPAAFSPSAPVFRAQMNLRPLGAWTLAIAGDQRYG